MAIKAYDKMTKAELIEQVTIEKLEDKVNESVKDVNNITNAEYVKVLKDNVKPKPKLKPKPVTIADISRDLNMMSKYIVTDHDTNTSIDGLDAGLVFSVTWGNQVLGMTTTNVSLNTGRPQGLPKGAVLRLAEVTTYQFQKNIAGEEEAVQLPRFTVVNVGGWTQAELDNLADQQKGRV
jgi:hypothetical protein